MLRSYLPVIVFVVLGAGIDRPRAVDAAALTAVRPLLLMGMIPGARDLFGLATGRPTQELIRSRFTPAAREAA